MSSSIHYGIGIFLLSLIALSVVALLGHLLRFPLRVLACWRRAGKQQGVMPEVPVEKYVRAGHGSIILRQAAKVIGIWNLAERAWHRPLWTGCSFTAYRQLCAERVTLGEAAARREAHP